ncbi:MAG: hypothetical protein VW879_08915, partial [Opitutae bacterium]
MNKPYKLKVWYSLSVKTTSLFRIHHLGSSTLGYSHGSRLRALHLAQASKDLHQKYQGDFCS